MDDTNILQAVTSPWLCVTGDYLREFVQICKRQESTDQLLGHSILDREDDTGELTTLSHFALAAAILTKVI